jgi:hypothetical protein
MHLETAPVPDLDLTHPELPPGVYDAEIVQISLRPSSYATRLGISYRVSYRDGDHFIWEELPIQAPRKSAGYARTAEGKARLYQIFTAFGEAPPERIHPLDLEQALVGREVCIRTYVRTVGSIAVSAIDSVLGKARQPVSPPTA